MLMILLMIVSVGFGVYAIFSDNYDTVYQGAVSVVTGLFVFIWFLAASFDYGKLLSVRDHSTEYLIAQNERIEALKEELKNIQYMGDGSLFEPANAELVKAISSATMEMTKVKSDIALAEREINYYKNSPHWPVTLFYND